MASTSMSPRTHRSCSSGLKWRVLCASRVWQSTCGLATPMRTLKLANQASASPPWNSRSTTVCPARAGCGAVTRRCARRKSMSAAIGRHRLSARKTERKLANNESYLFWRSYRMHALPLCLLVIRSRKSYIEAEFVEYAQPDITGRHSSANQTHEMFPCRLHSRLFR